MMKTIHVTGLAIVAALMFSVPAPAAIAADALATSVDAAKLGKDKQTKPGLYVTAVDSAKAVEEVKGAILIDIRSRAEVNFLGIPTLAAANVPFKEMSLDYDAKAKSYTMVDNKDFVPAIEAVLKEKGLGKDAHVLLMCRSGGRSAHAANVLAEAGYTAVYSVVDGFEGDKDKTTGLRTVNGWKNAGLPYTLKVDGAVAYKPAK